VVRDRSRERGLWRWVRNAVRQRSRHELIEYRMDAHRALLEVARSLMRAGDSRELIYEILVRSRDVMDCEVCSVLLPDPETGDLVIRSTLGDSGPRDSLRVPPGQGISGEVFKTRRAINIADAQRDPRHYAPVPNRVGLVARAMLTIPLMDGNECLGAMQAINPRRRDVFGPEDEDIFHTFGSLVSATLVRVKAHEAALREAAAKREFALAHEIQASFLPPGGEPVDPFEVRAFYRPANEIGGDFYFWHRIDDDRLLVGLGDVCGKGLPAALDMARCSTLIPARVYLLRAIDLGEWVAQLNQELCKLMRAGRFIAATFLLLDASRRRLEVVCAGQFPPRGLTDSSWPPLPADPAPPLGINDSIKFKSRVWPLGLAREWLLYSDGLLERRDPDGTYFGDTAFESTLGSDPAPLDRLAQAWRAFGAGGEYQDDCTMLWVRDTRPTPPREFTGCCAPSLICGTRDFIESWAVHAGFDAREVGLVVLGVDEVVTNIFRYAYNECPGELITRVALEPDGIVIELSHHGQGIERAELPEARPASPDSAGGMGLGVVNTVFDAVEYSKGEETSRITLRKSWW
jgi:serine phosphatase RsbU (regulator of sigma subunit)/anti-sigma regulatory factor (Ser/Thr protein kinase)